MGSSTIGVPIIDISPLIEGEDDQEIKKEITETIGKACFEYGYFQIINHGMPIEVMNQAVEYVRTISGSLSNAEKIKLCPKHDLPLPVGYWKLDQNSTNGECFSMFPSGSPFNVLPNNSPVSMVVMDEAFTQLAKIARVIESAINECLGLPQNYLNEYNNGRESDILTSMHYYPTIEGTIIPQLGHEDPSFLTIEIHDQTGGLEFLKDGNWIRAQGGIVVYLGELAQVLSNDRIKSVTHRVVTKPGEDLNSLLFAYMVGMSKLVQPLPPLTVNEAPHYKGFNFGEYLQLILESSNSRQPVSINHYTILPK